MFPTGVLTLVRVPSLLRQSKHQKHQAFEAELHANADRIRGVIDTGNALIQRGACAGSEDAVKVGSHWEGYWLMSIRFSCSAD